MARGACAHTATCSCVRLGFSQRPCCLPSTSRCLSMWLCFLSDACVFCHVTEQHGHVRRPSCTHERIARVHAPCATQPHLPSRSFASFWATNLRLCKLWFLQLGFHECACAGAVRCIPLSRSARYPLAENSPTHVVVQARVHACNHVCCCSPRSLRPHFWGKFQTT